MRVTEVNLTPIKPRGGLIAFASCVIDGAIFCGSIAVYVRPNGSFRLLYPVKKMGNSDMSIYHPINHEASNNIESASLKKCDEIFNQKSEGIAYGHSSYYD